MPFCSTLLIAAVRRSSSLTRLAASSSTISLKASRTFIFLDFFLSRAIPANMPRSCSAISSMPGAS